jgi:hypothetical protein
MIKPIFTKAEISDLDQFASFADRFMELLPANGDTVDIQPLLHRLVSLPASNHRQAKNQRLSSSMSISSLGRPWTHFNQK